MKKQRLLHLIILLTAISSCTEPKKEILLENFDLNTRGWIEEETKFHKLEIKNGYYYIKSKDSSLDRTSCRSIDKSYLFELPKKYKIQTSIELIHSEIEIPYCGLILESPSYEYEFIIYNNGKVKIREYNYSIEDGKYFEKIDNLKIDNNLEKVELEILIDGWFFELLVNQQSLGKGKLNAKSWERIAPFTGRFTEIGIDYLKLNR